MFYVCKRETTDSLKTKNKSEFLVFNFDNIPLYR